MQDIDKAGISEESSIYLVGGTPRMRSLFAVTFDEHGQSDQVILLETNWINDILPTLLANFSENPDIPVFSFEEFPKIFKLAEFPDDANWGVVTGDLKGTSINAKYAMWIIFGLFFLSIICIGLRKALKALHKN